MSTIDLTLDNNNELTFQVNIEGSSPAKPSCRFLIEGEEMSFAFPGEMANDGIVHVNIPPLEKVLNEGSYNSGLEVIVDDRVFVPLTLTANFEKSVKVTAEAVNRRRRPSTSATAQLIGTSVKNRGSRGQTLIGESLSTPSVKVVNKESKNRQRIKDQPRDTNKETNMNNLSENQIRNLIRNMIDSKQ